MSDEQLPDLGQVGAEPEPPARGAKPAAAAAAPKANPGAAPSPGSLAAVMELEVPVSIELGRTQMAIEEVLALGRGSVVQLDRLVGQPVEVFVSDKPVATGEVVVTGEKFGVRILRIQEPISKAGEVA